jgi:Protein of unknown function (DUF2796)
MNRTLLVLTVGLLLAAPTHAEEKRQADKHEHGHGTLNIAIEGNTVAIELDAPGMDIAGFEHAAETDEQKATITKATALLEKPLGLFQMPKAAGCAVIEAKAGLETESQHDAGDAESGKDAKKDEDQKAGETHSGFSAVYKLDCTNVAALTSIQFDYFKTFAGAEELEVTVISAKGQNSYEVTRDKPELFLTGSM